MAIIKTIRDKYAKLAGVIIGIALIGFVLMDFGSGSGNTGDTLAKVNGKKISYVEYENFIQLREQTIQSQNPQMTLNDLLRAQLRDQAWEDLISEQLLSELYEDLGLVVSDAELNDLVYGNNPDPIIRQIFTDPNTGQYNPQQAAQTINQVKNDPEWKMLEEEIVSRRLLEKLNTLISGGLYVPTFFAEQEMAMQGAQAEGSFVMLPFSLIADNEVEVTDQDLEQYIQKNAKAFTNKEELRSIEYVSFVAIPSAEDTAKALAQAENLKEEFMNTTKEELPGFISLNNAGANSFPTRYFAEEELSFFQHSDDIWNGGVNNVIGPVFENDYILLSKVTERHVMPEEVTARHIFIASMTQGQEIKAMSEAKQKIDSAIAELNQGVAFEEVAQKYSEDPSIHPNTFLPQHRSSLMEPIAEFVYSAPKNAKKLIEIDDENGKGYYYFEITDRSEATKTYQNIAFIAQNFDADKNTLSNIYNNASTFASRVQGGEDFKKVAEEMGKTVRVANGLKKFSHLIPSLGASQEMGRWAQNAKVGAHSSIIDIDDQFVIARVTEIQPKGLIKVTDANRVALRNIVLQEKKAAKLSETYNNNHLETIAAQSGQIVQNFESISFTQSFIPGLGQEPKVAGWATNPQHVNQVSPGIHGNTGVIYVLTTQHEEGVQQGNVDMMKQFLIRKYNEEALPIITDQLMEKANIKDLREKVYR